MHRRLPNLLSDIAANAEARPDAPALLGSDGTLSYRELRQETERVAKGLCELGISPGQRVAFLAHKTTAAVVAMIGIMRAGAAYVPLDPRAPTARLVELVNDADCPVVLVSAGQDASLAEAFRDRTMARPVNTRTLRASGNPSLPQTVSASAVALCLYTSGSTGRPKGVQLTYESIQAFHDGFNELSRMTSDSRCLNVAALHFDVSLFDVLLPLRLGAVVHLGPQIPVPEVILGIVTEQRITHMSSVGSTMTLLADESHDFRGYDLSSLQALLTGAEIINPRTVQRWLAAAPELVVINAYGPAETTCAVINHCINEREPNRTEFYPIGLPLPGTQIRFRDEDGQISGDGPGEILIAGVQLMAGYLNRPEEEARAFLASEDVRYYRTGDWGSRRPDGIILFEGRRDDEVKVRGYRVNLNEIKRGLEAHPRVERAFVVPVGEGFGAQRLACAVSLGRPERLLPGALHEENLELLTEDLERALRRHLSDRLPSYMLPALFYALPSLPVLSSGKPNVAMIRQWVRESAEELR